MVATIILSLPLIHLQKHEPIPWILAAAFVLFVFATCGPSAIYVSSQRVLYPGNFIRTPKLGIHRRGDRPARLRAYWLKINLLPYLELALGLYALLALSMALVTKGIWLSPFLFIYACGFLYVSLTGIGESLDLITWRFRLIEEVKPVKTEEPDGT